MTTYLTNKKTGSSVSITGSYTPDPHSNVEFCPECKGAGNAQVAGSDAYLSNQFEVNLDQNCVYCDGVGVCDNKKDER